ncbi:hypothetical protein PIB30_044139 [Stylosanthes scabra]|uniref:Uncharacterized protein n=1 Tax=Stylosanthes scabra TaxID=79078 RepID=A0ABU6UF14_9FABA|nr:hypothetical protein [Stylosanthes scabra]
MVLVFVENQMKLHGFPNEQDRCSLWFPQFPFVSLADDVALAQATNDVELVNGLVGARLLCIGRSREIKHNRDELEKGKMAMVLNENFEKAKQLAKALEKLTMT